ncbi:MAG: hypothetical protein OEM25_03885, partial [Gammaproteobacteria bacterium]|nr:hypothetical protein [Gammaproteobacteria bacterium]
MNKGVLIAAAVLLVGLVAAASVYVVLEREPAISAGAGQYFDQSAALDERVNALEAAVAEERNARQLLEEELQILYAEIESLSEQREQQGEQRAADAVATRERIVDL